MADLALKLPDPLVQFIDSQVGPHGFADRQSAIEAVVSDWQDRMNVLRAAIQEGLDDIENGAFEDIQDLQAWSDNLKASAPGA
jgi:Arc/MetJ-type ribon-helix-helix transcriptional regulator